MMKNYWWSLVWLMLLSPLCYGGEIADLDGHSSITLAEEERIGTKWWRQNYWLLNPYHDFLLQLYLEDLVARLRQGEELASYRMTVRILSSQDFNAFAAPGGIVGVNLGLWRLAETESELASVLAHELAHLSQRHFIRMLEDAQQRNDVSLASAIAGLGLVLTGNVPAGVLAIYGAAGYQLESQLETSRRFEREADSQASVFMYRGDFSINDATNLYRRLLQSKGTETGTEYMRTHPFLIDRINDAQLRALNEDQQVTHRHNDYVYARIRVLTKLGLGFTQEQGMSTAVTDYAKAMELQQKGEHHQAAQLLKKVSDQYPLSTFLLLSYVEALIEAGQTKLAINLLLNKKKYNGGKTAWDYFLAQAYAADKKFVKAVEHMEIVAQRRYRDEHIWQELQSYYIQAGDKYNTFRTRMAYQLLTGETKSAKVNYDLALQEVKDNEVFRARLENLYRSLQVS